MASFSRLLNKVLHSNFNNDISTPNRFHSSAASNVHADGLLLSALAPDLLPLTDSIADVYGCPYIYSVAPRICGLNALLASFMTHSQPRLRNRHMNRAALNFVLSFVNRPGLSRSTYILFSRQTLSITVTDMRAISKIHEINQNR